MMKFNKILKTAVSVLLAVGIAVTGLPYGGMKQGKGGLPAVEAAVDIHTVLTAEQQKEITFNAYFYANLYGDLKNAFGYDEGKLYEHYLVSGIYEGRWASPVFNPRYYLAMNGAFYGDLASMDAYSLQRYFLKLGIYETCSANSTGMLVDTTVLRPIVYYPVCRGYPASIVAALDSLGIDSSDSHLAKIASANRVDNYHGSEGQNLYLLRLLMTGRLINPDGAGSLLGEIGRC